jgi:anti-anti-sigma regulatory factor
MNFLVEKDGMPSAPEDLTIPHAQAFKDDLVALLNGGDGPLRLSLADVEQVDTAAVQLLFAATVAARKQNRELALVEPSGSCLEVIRQLGLEQQLLGPNPDSN